jgi:hypothetical protein
MPKIIKCLQKLVIRSYFFLLGICITSGQEFKHKVHFQTVGLLTDNLSETKTKLNFRPNFGYGINYKKISIYAETFSSTENNANFERIEGSLLFYNINSYSILFGYSIYLKNNFKITSGAGIRYNHGVLGYFTDYFPRWFESHVCHEYSTFGPVIWHTFDLKIYKNVSVSLANRFNPMLKNYQYKYIGFDSPCSNSHSHDKYNYFTNQLTINYNI